MAINVSVLYNGGLLPEIILFIQCYYHRGTRLNAMTMVLSLQPMIPPKGFDIFPRVGCSEGLGAFRTEQNHKKIAAPNEALVKKNGNTL